MWERPNGMPHRWSRPAISAFPLSRPRQGLCGQKRFCSVVPDIQAGNRRSLN